MKVGQAIVQRLDRIVTKIGAGHIDVSDPTKDLPQRHNSNGLLLNLSLQVSVHIAQRVNSSPLSVFFGSVRQLGFDCNVYYRRASSMDALPLNIRRFWAV